MVDAIKDERAAFPAATAVTNLLTPPLWVRFRKMINATSQLSLLLDLETRHEQLLLQLEELDRRVESVLAECQKDRSYLPRSEGRKSA